MSAYQNGFNYGGNPFLGMQRLQMEYQYTMMQYSQMMHQAQFLQHQNQVAFQPQAQAPVDAPIQLAQAPAPLAEPPGVAQYRAWRDENIRRQQQGLPPLPAPGPGGARPPAAAANPPADAPIEIPQGNLSVPGNINVPGVDGGAQRRVMHYRYDSARRIHYVGLRTGHGPVREVDMDTLGLEDAARNRIISSAVLVRHLGLERRDDGSFIQRRDNGPPIVFRVRDNGDFVQTGTGTTPRLVHRFNPATRIPQRFVEFNGPATDTASTLLAADAPFVAAFPPANNNRLLPVSSTGAGIANHPIAALRNANVLYYGHQNADGTPNPNGIVRVFRPNGPNAGTWGNPSAPAGLQANLDRVGYSEVFIDGTYRYTDSALQSSNDSITTVQHNGVNSLFMLDAKDNNKAWVLLPNGTWTDFTINNTPEHQAYRDARTRILNSRNARGWQRTPAPDAVRERSRGQLLIFWNTNSRSNNDTVIRLADGRLFRLDPIDINKGSVWNDTANRWDEITIDGTPAHQVYRDARTAIQTSRTNRSWVPCLPSVIREEAGLLTYNNSGSPSHRDTVHRMADGRFFLLHSTNNDRGWVWNDTRNDWDEININASPAHQVYRDARTAIQTSRTARAWVPHVPT